MQQSLSQRRRFIQHHRLRQVMIVFLAVYWLAIGWLLVGRRTFAEYTLNIANTSDVGTVSKPGGITTRDGGASGMLGDKILWTFGDTLYQSNDPVTLQPDYWRSATSGLASPSDPTNVSADFDSHGAPYQLIPYNNEELTYNRTYGNANNRYAVWPTSVVTLDGQNSLIFFRQLKINGPLNYDLLGVGIARINVGAKQATREPNLLFSGNEPQFHVAVTHGDTVYVFDCTNVAPNPCVVAKAPLGQISNHDAYQAWTGSGWGKLTDAQPVFNGSSAGLSVQWNPLIQKFITYYIPPFSNTIYYRTADSPEGPWSSAQLLRNVPGQTGLKADYTSYSHAEIDPSGQSLWVSYYQPDGTNGDLHLFKSTLAGTTPAVPATSASNTSTTSSSKSTTPTTNGSAASNTVSAPTHSIDASQAGTSQTAVHVLGKSVAMPTAVKAAIAICVMAIAIFIAADQFILWRRRQIDFQHHFPDHYTS